MLTATENTPKPVIKKCTNHIRGCRTVLEEDYTRTKCEDCLRKDRERDKKRREDSKAKQQEGGETGRKCTTCFQEYPLDQFQGLKTTELTKTCQKCRDGNKKQDARRDKEHRNELARICSKKPEQIARKKEWVENNYDKCVEAWQKHRQTRIEEDTELYLQKNAENAKRWRENNPEKYKETVEKVKNSVNHQFTTYKRTAFYKNLDFGLNLEQFENIVTKPCYYCGEFTKGCCINGIDRKESSGCYDIDNTDPCCNICNMMKNTLNQYTFIRRIEHILTVQRIIDGKLFPEVFTNYRGGPINTLFSRYRNSAKKRSVDFDVDSAFLKKLVSEDCYLCGKGTTQDHQNGIDRFDNDIGYLPQNCKSCCFNCNLMKKNYTFDELIRKMLLIYNLHKDDTFEDIYISKGIELSNKLTPAEMTEYKGLQKEQRIIQLKEKYTPEEIKKNAVRLAESRKSKQISTIDNSPLEDDFAYFIH